MAKRSDHNDLRNSNMESNEINMPKKLLMGVGIAAILQLATTDSTESKIWYAVIIGSMCVIYKLVQIFKRREK